MTYVIRTTKCANGVVEKTKFPVIEVNRSSGTLRRGDKRAINREAKANGDARRHVARLLNNNFKSGDKFLTLDLSDAGMEKVVRRAEKEREKEKHADWKDLLHVAMEKELENLCRRAIRLTKVVSEQLLYVAAVSDMTDPEDDDHSARLHIHMVANASAAECVKEKWKAMGTADEESLSVWATKDGVPDWSALASYMIGQTRTVGTGHRYTASRNLKMPEHTDRIAVRPDALLRAPAGSVVLEVGQYIPGRAQYIRYLVQKEWENEKRRHTKMPDDIGGSVGGAGDGSHTDGGDRLSRGADTKERVKGVRNRTVLPQ